MPTGHLNGTAKLAGRENIRGAADKTERPRLPVPLARPWRSLGYECVYLQAFETGPQARTGIGGRIDYSNTSRPHPASDGRTPEAV